MQTIHCSICSKSISGTTFKVRMDKLRRHRKEAHPTAHARATRKTLKTKRKRGIINKRNPGKLKRFIKGSPEAKRFMAKLRKIRRGTLKRRKRTYYDSLYARKKRAKKRLFTLPTVI